MSAPARAYAFARVCAHRGMMLRPEELFAVRGTTDEQASMHAASALGIENESKRFARLLKRYRLVLRVYPEHAALIRALLRLHEIENLKLAWRALVRDADPEAWVPLWRDFGDLAEIPRIRGVASLHDFVELLRATPYGAIAAEVFKVSPHAEMAFDRWASAEIVRLAKALPRSEALAREIALRIVRKRDDELRARGAATFGMSEAAVEAAIVVRERSPRRTRDPFAGQAFRFAPALALIELAEREYEQATAVVERRGDPQLDDATDVLCGARTAQC